MLIFQNVINSNLMYKTAFEILNEINNKGYECLLVGGFVRDLIMGHSSHDIDISTNAPMELLDEMYPTFDIGKNKNFGVSIIKKNGFDFEICQFRLDGEYSDGRHPDEIKIAKSFNEDVKRRDLTINALGINCDGDVFDYTLGLFDIHKGIIRAVGIPHKRFKDDALRLLRTIRFASKYNFEINTLTKRAIKKLAHTINLVSPERIKDELWKMASQKGDCFANSLELMRELGILDKILPEFTALLNVNCTPQFHPETAYVRKIIK